MNEQPYTAALEGAALYDESSHGRIRMRGESAADLLHRLSTNDMLKLRPGQGARTVLLTPIGRMIDLLTVYKREDSLVVVTGPNQGGIVFSHLRKNIFFNDKVTLEPLGRSHVQFALYGPNSAALLKQTGGVLVAELPLHASVFATIAGAEVLVARAMPIGGAGFRLLAPAEAAEAVQAAILAAGAAMLDEATFDVLRVEHGYGAVAHELSQEYIPLETGLLDAISFAKGCYVGQEIIARMESRGRLAKTLRGLRFVRNSAFSIQHSESNNVNAAQRSGATQHAERSTLTLPAKLDAGGKEAGDLTSVVQSPRFGLIALAYVRTAHAEPGTRLGIGNSEATGEVVELPFA